MRTQEVLIVVRRGADGSLHFLDRKKNVIRRSGENISAVEVESVLMEHAAIERAAVRQYRIACAAMRSSPAW